MAILTREVVASKRSEFQSWALGDLKDNANRGVFAEWLVAQLLGIKLGDKRESWAACDLVTDDDIKIEVKSAAYRQSWKQKRDSKIVFSGLRSGNRGADQPFASERTYNADWYVFCVQIEKNDDRWNALDLGQWRFYLLSAADLRKINQSSITLSMLAGFGELTAEELNAKRQSLTK